MRTITPASHERGIAPVVLLAVTGIGRNVSAMKRGGHTNPAAHSYDRAGAAGNQRTEAVFSGDVTVFRKSTGWLTVRDGFNDTHTFAPDSVVVFRNGTKYGTGSLNDFADNYAG